MKKTVSLCSLLLVLFATASTVFAQKSVREIQNGLSARTGMDIPALRAGEALLGFGYADRAPEDVTYVGLRNSGYYITAFIKLPDVGVNKITKIAFPASKESSKAQVVILSEDGKSVLYYQDVTVVAGNNIVDLETPFDTEAGKRYLVGFSVKSEGTGQNDPYVAPFDGSVDIEDANYLCVAESAYPEAKGGAMQSVFGNGFGSVMVFVTLDKQDVLNDMGYPLKATGNFELVKKDEEVATKISIRNVGMNEIASMELSYAFGSNAKKTLTKTLDSPLAAGATGEVVFTIPAEAEGMGQLHIAITKVNGNENNFAATELLLPYQIGDNDAIPTETVLIERFTSEMCGNCPPQDKNVRELKEKFANAGMRVSFVMHHAGYYADWLTVAESEQLIQYIYGGQGSYAPAIAINRTYVDSEGAIAFHPASKNISDMIFSDLSGGKQGAKINQIQQTIKEDKLEVTVNGIGLKNAFDPEDFYLTVILTEDDIAAKSQAGGGSGYKHEAVPRKFLTAAFGKKLSPAADGTFSETLSADLLKDWKRENCKVVAFIHKNLQSQDAKSRNVYASETATLGEATSNQDLTVEKAPVVTVSDGYLTISGAVDSFEVYDMAGVLVTTDTATRLLPGTYIVRVFNDLRTYTTKVLVL